MDDEDPERDDDADLTLDALLEEARAIRRAAERLERKVAQLARSRPRPKTADVKVTEEDRAEARRVARRMGLIVREPHER